MNVALVAPLGTVTDAVTAAEALEELNEIVDPPDPAFLESVTFPVADAPPDTEAGETERLRTVCACASAAVSAKASSEPNFRREVTVVINRIIGVSSSFCQPRPKSRRFQPNGRALAHHNTTEGSCSLRRVSLAYFVQSAIDLGQ